MRGKVINAITPETDVTTNYFWLRMRDHSLGDDEFTATHRAMVSSIFEEDRAMLNAQQIAINAHPGYDFYNLKIDAGGLWVRRLIDRLADHQSGHHSSAATASR